MEMTDAIYFILFFCNNTLIYTNFFVVIILHIKLADCNDHAFTILVLVKINIFFLYLFYKSYIFITQVQNTGRVYTVK